MNGVSLEQFMQLRNSAATRMQSQATTQASTQTSQTSQLSNATTTSQDWVKLLESKRREFGVDSSATTQRSQNIVTATQNFSTTKSVQSSGDYLARAQELRSLLQQGSPVRTTGNLLDVRA